MSAFTLLLAAIAALTVAPLAPLVVHDIDGHAWSLLAPTGSQIDLLFFIAPDCPVSNRYAPEITRVCGDYQRRGVRCFTVYPDVDRPAVVKRHRQEYGFGPTVAAVLDRDRAIVRAVQPLVTPEVAVYAAGTGRVYRGRIDDLYVDVGRSRRQPTRHDLRLALDDVLAGRRVAVPETEAVGCSIQAP